MSLTILLISLRSILNNLLILDCFQSNILYNNFINFTRDLESNLRIVDISSIEFLSSTSVLSGSSPDSYKYNFKVKTYWLKN